MSRSLLAMAVLVSTALITACSQPDKPANTPPSSASDLPKPAPAEFTGTLAAPGSGTAFSYNPAAPIGAQLTVKIASGEGSTTVDFSAKGMQPSRGYAVHAHTKPCGATG